MVPELVQQAKALSVSAGTDIVRKFLASYIIHAEHSQAQLSQDAFVLSVLNEKRGGYFVEFGAGDGKTLSNTYLLEKSMGWTGILAEPNRDFIASVREKRHCIVDHRCVWTVTGQQMSFSQTPYGELSTLTDFVTSDSHDRSNAVTYDVETVSLEDLLETNRAPRQMDYLSLDTEGSELAILNATDLDKWRFRVITVEHNFTPARDAILDLLVRHGYSRVLPEFSLWDDWYVADAG